MDLDRESGNRKDLIQLNISTTARQSCTRRNQDAVSSFNLIDAEDNILSTARPGEGDAVDFHPYNGIYAL